jgi:formylglycine-generating enzyme required for sulfatase activity
MKLRVFRVLAMMCVAVSLTIVPSCKDDETEGENTTTNDNQGNKDENEKEENPGNDNTNNLDKITEDGVFAHITKDEMVLVEGGTYMMGAQDADPNSPNYEANDVYAYYESPVRKVTIPSFYIGKYEVTQDLWDFVMHYDGLAADGSKMEMVEETSLLDVMKDAQNVKIGANYPIGNVSHDDIVKFFIPRLNKITGKSYRLPSEAEWEYAARGGMKDEYTASLGVKGEMKIYSGSNNPSEIGWYVDGATKSEMHEGGKKSPNALGIYDMSGNMFEWCRGFSEYTETEFTDNADDTQWLGMVGVRGGAYIYAESYMRIAKRTAYTPNTKYFFFGFRLAHSVVSE